MPWWNPTTWRRAVSPPRLEMSTPALPVAITQKPVGLSRIAGRLARLMLAVEAGDERQELRDEIKKHQMAIAGDGIDVPQTAAEAVELFRRMG